MATPRQLRRGAGAAAQCSFTALSFGQMKVHVMNINITDIFSFALIPSLNGFLPFRLFHFGWLNTKTGQRQCENFKPTAGY